MTNRELDALLRMNHSIQAKGAFGTIKWKKVTPDAADAEWKAYF